MAGNPISPLLADAALVFLWPRLLRESRPSHIPISRLPCGKRRKGSVSALCVCKGDTPPTCSEIMSFSASKLSCYINFHHLVLAVRQFIFGWGVACNIRLAPHSMFYLIISVWAEEQDITKKQGQITIF